MEYNKYSYTFYYIVIPIIVRICVIISILYIKGDNKRCFKICTSTIFYDYKTIDTIDELSQVRKCMNNTFHETIPVSRVLVTLSFIDGVILEIIDNDIEDIIENVYDLRANILYMLAFQKVVKEDVDKPME